MQTIVDFLNFKLMISPVMLLVLYYFGAIVLPIAAWLFARWLVQRFVVVANAFDQAHSQLKAILKPEHRVLMILLFVCAFLSAEIVWRMMFEFLIAYFQMRDALLLLNA